MNGRRSLASDLTLNYATYGVAGVSGIGLLYGLAYTLGNDGLGTFVQVMNLYVIVGQLAVGGVQFSALRTAAGAGDDFRTESSELWSAVLAAFLWSGLVTTLCWLFRGQVVWLLPGSRLVEAWTAAIPALVIFACNKTMASCLNGLSRMRSFAVQTLLRGLFLASIGCMIAITTRDPVLTCFCIPLSEALLACYLVQRVAAASKRPSMASLSLRHVRSHLGFGFRGVWSGLAYEINVRSDSIVVGHLLGAGSVGIYGPVSQIAEGCFNLLVVVRNVLAPRLGIAAQGRNHDLILRIAGELMRRLVPIGLGMALIISLSYGPLASLIMPARGFESGAVPLGLLLLGLALSAWVVPLDTVLLTAGFPGTYSLVLGMATVTNVAANWLLIQPFGLVGAATGTLLATLASNLYLIFAIRWRLGFWLLPWPRSIRPRSSDLL